MSLLLAWMLLPQGPIQMAQMGPIQMAQMGQPQMGGICPLAHCSLHPGGFHHGTVFTALNTPNTPN